MVILIARAGCAGKTLMAQKLLKKYKMPYLSIKYIAEAVFKYNHRHEDEEDVFKKIIERTLNV